MEPLSVGRVMFQYDNPDRPLEQLRKRRKLNTPEENEEEGNECNGKGNEDESDQESEEDDCLEEAKKQDREYEVENIVDRCDFGSGCVFYFVKWKYWNARYNTWEPAEHLDCQKSIEEYVKFVEDRKFPNKCIDEYIRILVNPTKEKLESFMLTLRASKVKKTYRVRTEIAIRRSVTAILKSNNGRRESLVMNLKRDLLIKYFYVRRVRQCTALREWEEEMGNSTNEGLPLQVENNVDLEGPPDNFFYVNEYIPGRGVVIPDDPPVGCKCKTCDGRSKCCSLLAEFKFAYTGHGTLQVPFDTPIYECNKRCKCDAKCANRVVQLGCRVKLCIFRTSNGCGWGVKTLENIRKGSFICCYVGEVIQNDEAESRLERYQGNPHTYLFDMDYNGSHYNYTVDGTMYGNVSRFINHSCKPNLTVCFVWIECLDPSLPQLAFFTTSFIPAGQELTIDYIGDSIKVDASVRRTKPCKCSAAKCKKFIL